MSNDAIYSHSQGQNKSPPTVVEAYTVRKEWITCPDCKRRLGRASVGSEVELKCRHCSKKAKREVIWNFKI